jgi:WD40 repeat protein
MNRVSRFYIIPLISFSLIFALQLACSFGSPDQTAGTLQSVITDEEFPDNQTKGPSPLETDEMSNNEDEAIQGNEIEFVGLGPEWGLDAVSPSGKLIAIEPESGYSILAINNLSEVSRITPKTNQSQLRIIKGIFSHDDHKIAVFLDDDDYVGFEILHLYEVISGAFLQEFIFDSRSDIEAIELAPDLSLLAIEYDDKDQCHIRFWNIDNGQLIEEFSFNCKSSWEGISTRFDQILFSSNNNSLVVVSLVYDWDNPKHIYEVKIFDSLNGILQQTIEFALPPDSGPETFYMSSDLDTVALSFIDKNEDQGAADQAWEHVIMLIDSRSRNIIRELRYQGDFSNPIRLAFSPDENYIAATSKYFTRIWNINNGNLLAVIPDPGDLGCHNVCLTNVNVAGNYKLLMYGWDAFFVK